MVREHRGAYIMAWVGQLDGNDDYWLLDSAINAVGDFKFVFTNFKFLSDPTAINFNSILGSNSDNSSYFMARNDGGNSDWQFKAGTSNDIDYSLLPINQNRTGLTIERIGGTLHVTFDTATQSVACDTSNFLFESITGQAGVFFGHFDFETLEYYNSSSTLVNKWDATASSHAPGTPILTETIGGNDATGVNMATGGTVANGGVWLDLGGGGISIAPDTINSTSVSLDPVITFNSILQLAPLAINSSSVSLDPVIQFSSSLTLSPSEANSSSVALNPTIEYTSALVIAPQAINSASISINPLIEFKSVINLTPDVINSISVSHNPIITTGQVQKIGTVTAGFADDLYSVKYKLSGITVNFKE